ATAAWSRPPCSATSRATKPPPPSPPNLAAPTCCSTPPRQGRAWGSAPPPHRRVRGRWLGVRSTTRRRGREAASNESRQARRTRPCAPSVSPLRGLPPPPLSSRRWRSERSSHRPEPQRHALRARDEVRGQPLDRAGQLEAVEPGQYFAEHRVDLDAGDVLAEAD